MLARVIPFRKSFHSYSILQCIAHERHGRYRSQRAEHVLSLHNNSLVWLRCNYREGDRFRLPQGHFPVLAGVNASGDFQYVAKHGWNYLFLVTEGEFFDKPYYGYYYLLVLAWEPSELLQTYGPIPDDAIDPTGPFYWKQPCSYGYCGPNHCTCEDITTFCRAGAELSIVRGGNDNNNGELTVEST